MQCCLSAGPYSTALVSSWGLRVNFGPWTVNSVLPLSGPAKRTGSPARIFASDRHRIRQEANAGKNMPDGRLGTNTFVWPAAFPACGRLFEGTHLLVVFKGECHFVFAVGLKKDTHTPACNFPVRIWQPSPCHSRKCAEHPS